MDRPFRTFGNICTCKELREIVHVWTETIGERVKRMEPLGVVETWRFVLDIYAPVSGRLIELNGKIMDNPSIISQDPYGSGWIAEIEPINLENEIKGLLSSTEYEQYCNELCLACPKKNCPLSSSA